MASSPRFARTISMAKAGTITIRTASGRRVTRLTDDGSSFFVGSQWEKPSDALMASTPTARQKAVGESACANDHFAHACRAAHISPAASVHVLRHTMLPTW